jgi:uncharacterized protein (DUF3084 family)
MSRTSELLAVLTTEPTSTSELYERIGYPTLARLGLIPYHAFRAELAALAATGAIESATAPDGSTVWRRRPEDDRPNESTPVARKADPPTGPILG